jgi:chemotaxis protein methyltransferase CheR
VTPRDREHVARLCAARAGLQVDADKDYLIESRLGPVARREGFASVADLVQAVVDREEERLVCGVVEAMALAETSFFRDREVFQHLFADVLPDLAVRRDGQPIRIWSAACGSGQEVYSLAMMLDHATPPGARVELFASDLSERLLEKARSGLYSQFEVQRGLPARLLVRHFRHSEEQFQLNPQLRQQVRWRRVNLTDDLSQLGQFDIVLCRNVLGSLTEAARAQVLGSLASAVSRDGCLVLGLGEQALGLVQGDHGVWRAASARQPASSAKAA